MKEPSAVEWLVEQLFGDNEIIGCSDELLNKAKEIDKRHKKQLVIGTYIDLKMKDCQLPYGMEYLNERAEIERNAEKYYNENFREQW